MGPDSEGCPVAYPTAGTFSGTLAGCWAGANVKVGLRGCILTLGKLRGRMMFCSASSQQGMRG